MQPIIKLQNNVYIVNKDLLQSVSYFHSFSYSNNIVFNKEIAETFLPCYHKVYQGTKHERIRLIRLHLH